MLLSVYPRKIYFVYCCWSQLEAEAGCPAGHEALYLRLPHHVPRVHVVVGPRVWAAACHEVAPVGPDVVVIPDTRQCRYLISRLCR